MSLITPEEFTGIYKVAQDQYSAVELTAYIAQMQPKILVHLFGVELYGLFYAATTSGTVAPAAGRFLTVYNEGQWQDSTGSGYVFYTGSPYNPCVQPSVEGGFLPGQQPPIHISHGIKDMLKGFVYYEYNRNNDVQATPQGNRTPDSMAANASSGPLRNSRLQDAYNRAMESYQAIQWYMQYGENSADYPEYAGICKSKMFFGGSI